MLTVNIVRGGNQRTIEAKEAEGYSDPGSPVYSGVYIVKPGGEIETITQSKVFVMNESGSTVARYDFETQGPEPADAMVPLG